MSNDNNVEFMSQEEPQTVSATKQCFQQYFSTIGKKDFKQFYYDWHVDAMIEPFAEVAEYFSRKYPQNSSEKFREFVEEYAKSVRIYNIDCKKFCSVKHGIINKDSQLSEIIDNMADGYNYKRIYNTDKCALLLGIAELNIFPDTPVPVVIDEAVKLAGIYSTEKSTDFVNGILARYVREK